MTNMGRDKDKRPEHPVVHRHVGMAFHFDSAGWILCTETQIKKAEEERIAAEKEREKAENNRNTAEEKREEDTREAIKKVEVALESLGDAQRTYLIDLSGAYQNVALQVVSELAEGHPVLVYIREAVGGPISVMVRTEDLGDTLVFTSGSIETNGTDGIADISHKQYVIDKNTGNIQAKTDTVLSSLLTKNAILILDGNGVTGKIK